MRQSNEAFCLLLSDSRRDYFALGSAHYIYMSADLGKPLLHVRWGKSSGDVITKHFGCLD
jgi:hypothetical protein